MNSNFRKWSAAVACVTLLCAGTVSLAHEFSGNISSEAKIFKNDAILDEQQQVYGSISVQPEYFHDWQGGVQSLTVTGFARFSPDNESRTHADLRELYWSYIGDDWELRAGVRKIFWGVTESQHLVDIINQTDAVEGFDGEEKLGQPMINLALIKDWGTVDIFVLAGFREREFASNDARMRGPFLIDSDNPLYESRAESQRIDAAIRWGHVIGDWDVGLSHFYGTSREPEFVPMMTAQGVTLLPLYNIIHQTGLDVQATIENWLWKAEVIYRSGMTENFSAATAGLEYSFFDVRSTGLDIGLVAEYLYDTRGEDATTPFENDFMSGVRFALNDEQSTEALFGIIQDVEGDATVLSFEASRRVGEQFKLTAEAYLFTNTDTVDVLHNFRNDDYVQLELGYYF